MADSVDPIGCKITAINMFKPRRQEKINLLPQFIELNIFQSIFQACIKAEMVVVDPIGLFYNYPMVGEETIEIEYEPTRDNDGEGPNRTMEVFSWKFMVNSVRESTPMDTVRGQVYILELYSVEYLANAKERVQKAYYDSYDNMIKSILKDQNYLRIDTKKLMYEDRLFEKTKGQTHLVVPNMKPYEACSWFASRAVSENPDDRTAYFFFETFRGYNFLTYERMMLEPFGSDDLNREHRDTPRYAFMSNITPAIRTYLKTLKVPEHNLITALQVQKRWNTVEKIIAGYFENEYLDIDIWNKTIKSTPTKLDAMPNMKPGGNQVFNMNSDTFIQDAKHQSHDPDTATRVRYTISQAGGDQYAEPQGWELRWGKGTQQLTGLAQVVVTAAVPGDTRLNAGDLVELYMPQFHGFTDLKKDEYLEGEYLITEVKHTITTGQDHVCVLNMSRNSYNEKLSGKKMKYQIGN